MFFFWRIGQSAPLRTWCREVVYVYMSSLTLHSKEPVSSPPKYKYGTSASLQRLLFLLLPTTTNIMTDFSIHPLLSYSQYGYTSGLNQPTSWNICLPPEYAHYPSEPTLSLTGFDLSQPATQPPLSTLHIVCELFLGFWQIKIRRLEGHVTVGDVLEEIHNVLIRRISQEEWVPLSDKQKARITEVFETRCNTDVDPALCRSNGVIRMDCLLEHTWFSGLSMSFDMDSTCILTLRRVRP